MPLIYKHTNKLNGKSYIGFTSRSMGERWKEHCRPTNHKSHFQHAIAKYGEDAFTHEILEEGDYVTAEDHEVKWIAFYDTFKGYGYNCTEGGGNCSGEKHPWYGRKHSEATKRKMSLSGKGRVFSSETRLKMSISSTGKVASEASRAKMSSSGKGRKRTEATKEKMRRNNNASKYTYTINGKHYSTVIEVLEDFTCNSCTVRDRCLNPNFPSWVRELLNDKLKRS